VALVLYLAVAVLAVIGGSAVERAIAVLLTALVFLGFKVAWLFLFTPLGAPVPQDQPGGASAPPPR